MSSGQNLSWQTIFETYNIEGHDLTSAPFPITADKIKRACQNFTATSEKEPRILCTQTTRESRPHIFKQLGLFILPTRNGEYVIVKGEGYVDIPPITTNAVPYTSTLGFQPKSSFIGNSEMQHLDYAYAVSMVRAFIGDPSLVLTIRGRKYTPQFSFRVGQNHITAESVQTEVDSGYEGEKRIVLVEAKNSTTSNTIIRQLYYPYRQWKIQTGKDVSTLFFEKRGRDEYYFWEFAFDDEEDYNSIRLKQSARYRLDHA
ncbi:MAG: hypothetical protein MJE68_26930 [Proteobacteria bacterium]|nr:hypothetical protein [Pseudomonadota bacterium]